MEQPLNIKEYKNVLRKRFKERRRSMTLQQKADCDRKIANRLTLLSAYKHAKTIIAYVSTEIEVDTIQIIEAAFRDGKQVAVPRCVPGTREMEFYRIHNLQDLEVGSYQLLEPKQDPAMRLLDFSDSICVVPALACDRDGYRLGYGGGYYDRFLRNYPGRKILILYKSCLVGKLFHGRYDVPMDSIVTEYFVANIRPQKRKG